MLLYAVLFSLSITFFYTWRAFLPTLKFHTGIPLPKIVIDLIKFLSVSLSLLCILSTNSFANLQKDVVFENGINASINRILNILCVWVKDSMLGNCFTSPAPMIIFLGLSMTNWLPNLVQDARTWHIDFIKDNDIIPWMVKVWQVLPLYDLEHWRKGFGWLPHNPPLGSTYFGEQQTWSCNPSSENAYR